MSSTLNGAVVLITGANGGLGTEFVQQCLARGAGKVYATARTPRPWPDPRIVTLPMDVTSEEAVARAAAAATDTTVVINNAGVLRVGDSVLADSMADIRSTFETNFFGPLLVTRAFAPVLGANGGGALIDVHSIFSWLALMGSYSAAKAALWSATNSFRQDLAAQGTHVLGLHLGVTATPMTVGYKAPKNRASDVVRLALDGLEAGELEVITDERTAAVKQALSGPLDDLYPRFARPDVAGS